MNRAITAAFAALVLLSVAQAFWQYDRLPETVASHFDAAGKANGWMSRGTQTAWQIGTVLFIAGLLEGIARINRLIPDEHLNLPHRAYWLAPERRAATIAWIGTVVRLMGCVLLVFFIGLFHQVYRVNTGGGDITLPVAGLGLGLLAALGLILGAFVLRLVRPPAA